MKRNFLLLGIGVYLFSACGGGEESTDENTHESTDSTSTEEVVTESGAIDPFPDFPKDKLVASAGDIVLSPSKNWQEDATAQGGENVTFIFYKQTLAEPGDQYSKVDFMFDKGAEIPNYMIIPIKPNQTAKKGDIVLTWWQSGSGMKRAIVTDDADPASPKVNYIDIKWDNPATNSEGVGIGQMSEQIAPGTFHVMTSLWESGTTVAVKTDGKIKAAQVVKVSGDKVLTLGWGGSMAVYSKADCIPIVVKPNVKVGDAVQAPWVGSFVNTTVEKIDAKNGRVWCDDPYSDDPMAVPFGDVTTGLDIK